MKDQRPHRRKAQHGQGRNRGQSSTDQLVLYGYHTVRAALANPRRRYIRLLCTRNAAERLSRETAEIDLEAEIVDVAEITKITGREAVHQGMALFTHPLDGLNIDDVADARLIVVLDQITDPHNVGAIIRSAVAMGASHLVTTQRHTAPESGLLAKTASGGVDMLGIVHVPNLAQGLTRLRNMGFLCIGLDSDGPEELADTLTGNKIALVLGAEGAGLRRLTRERCDALARLDMPGPIKSLNVSNAAALTLHIAAQYLSSKA